VFLEVAMIFRSRFPGPLISGQHLPGFVLAAAVDRPGRTVLVDAVTGRRINYGQLREQVHRFAAGLSGLGLGKGRHRRDPAAQRP
jgi:non-ribosomal peptide synthetase component E (peptide arylation enzyme)